MKIKEKVHKTLNMPLPLKDCYVRNYEGFEFLAQVQTTKLFKKSVVRRFLRPAIYFEQDARFIFDNNAKCLQGRFVISGRRERQAIFQGLFVEAKTEHFYKEPIVFVKRGFFNGRKGLKKVQLRRQDSYFDVLSNDVNAAQNLCFQGITSKLVRLDKKLFKIDKIEASFFEDKLYIALYTKKNLFEPITKHFNDLHQYELFYDEIAAIENYCAQFRDL